MSLSQLRGGLGENRHRLLELMTDGYWEWNLQKDEAYYSPSWHQMLGEDIIEGVYGLNHWLERLHPEDRRWVPKYEQEKLTVSDEFLIRFRMLYKDNDYIWVESRGKVIERDEKTGKPILAAGVHKNIHDIITLQETISDEDEKNELLLGIVRHDYQVSATHEYVRKRIMFSSDSLFRSLGYTYGEFNDFFRNDSQQLLDEKASEAIKAYLNGLHDLSEGEHHTVKINLPAKNGESHEILFRDCIYKKESKKSQLLSIGSAENLTYNRSRNERFKSIFNRYHNSLIEKNENVLGKVVAIQSFMDLLSNEISSTNKSKVEVDEILYYIKKALNQVKNTLSEQ